MTSPHDSKVVQQQDVEYIVLPSTEDVQEKGLGDYVHILKKRKWLVLAPLFIILPLVILYLATQKPMYQAKSTVLIENVNPHIISIEEVLSTERTSSFPDFYHTQYEIIKSHTVLGHVVDALRLYDRVPEKEPELIQMINIVKSFSGNILNYLMSSIENVFQEISSDKKEEPPTIEGMNILSDSINIDPERQRRLGAIRQLRASLQVEPRKGTQLVDIILSGDNPVDVVQQVNTIAEAYARQNLENKLTASKKAITWLRKESSELKNKINKAELSLKNFREKKNFVPFYHAKGAQDPIQEKLNALQHSYMQIGFEKDDMRNRIQEISKLSKQDVEKMIGALPDILSSYSIEALKRKYAELNLEYNELSLIYENKHPKIIKVKSEIEKTINTIYSEIDQIINRMEKEYNILSEKEKNIEKELKTQNRFLVEGSNDLMQYEELQREVEIDKDLYLTLSKRLAETTLTEALESNNIKVVETAAVPGMPVASGKMKRMVLSAVVALAFGVGLAVFAETLDRGFKSVNEAERTLGVPFLGFIPNYKSKKNEPVALFNPGARASEAYRTLRTWIRLSSQNSVKVLLITSAIPGEGKSHTAANLAISFAQLGQAVLLIDADLRRPTSHRIFNIANNGGLMDILSHASEWQSVLHDTAMENLKVLPTGGIPHNPVELLSTRRMQDMLGRLKSAFDIIILDAPVILSIPDVTILTSEVDAVLLVHDPTKGDRDTVLESKKILDRAGANLLGMIFNNVNLKRQKHYYHSDKYLRVYKPMQPSHKTGVPFVDMRPIESRQKWIMQSEMTLNPSDHTESQT